MFERLFEDDIDDAGGYIAEVIYGANEGIVTTFAVVASVAGAALDPAIVLILGVANLLADGFSMGMSNGSPRHPYRYMITSVYVGCGALPFPFQRLYDVTGIEVL